MTNWMRTAAVLVCAFLLLGALPVSAGGEKETKKNSTASERPAARPASNEDVMTALEQLRALVETQNRQIEAQQAAMREQARKLQELEARLTQVSAASPNATGEQPAEAGMASAGQEQKPEELKLLEGQLEAVADSQAQLATRVGQVETNAATAQRSTEGKLRQIGNFSFSGDVRVRYEPFFGGGTPPSPSPVSRHRPRIRLRFNTVAKFSDEWTGGFSIATGDDTDPISTNQTLTSFFTRKPFRIDKAFVEYNPKWMKTLFRDKAEFKVNAGKFGYTWYRTELTLDNDLNPEGISESLAFKFKNPVFKGITLVGFQLPFNEASAGPDSFMQGGQIQTTWQLGSRIKYTGYIGFYDWNRADRIRAAQTSSPATISGSSNNNAATATQFASKFGILDVIGRLDFTTWSSKWPLMLQFNYASNTRACTNLVNIIGTPPVCDPSDRNAYWAEVQIGQAREPRDINFGYTFIRIEKEAVLGAFNFSDLRSPTNDMNHRINFTYQANRNVQLGFTGLFGRQLVTQSSGTQERILKRLQFDAIYKF